MAAAIHQKCRQQEERRLLLRIFYHEPSKTWFDGNCQGTQRGTLVVDCRRAKVARVTSASFWS
jgi:hypothetical protein